MKKNKKIIFISVGIIMFVLIIIYLIMSKNLKIGKNSSSQEVVDSILNLNSYKATIEVEVLSNKNENKYVIKQKYNQNEFYQEILEPINISGIVIKKENNNIVLENTKLNLKDVIENYNCLTDNCLDLNSFIEDCKNEKEINEGQNEIVIKTKNKISNKYIQNKTLYIDKITRLPSKMKIDAYNQKNTIYIKYSNIVINN